MLEQLPDFSPWFKFHERRIDTTILDQHGVDVLAHFEASIVQERANPLASEVFYAGKAYPGTAEARLNEFEEAAFHGKDDHDAGTCYRTRFPGEDETKLYAAIYPPIRPIAKLHESHIAPC